MKKLIQIIMLSLLPMIAFPQATGVVVNNMPSGGNLPQATLDGSATLNFNQTTSGQTINIPGPTNVNSSKNMMIRNIGSVGVTFNPGGYIDPGKLILMQWNGSYYNTLPIPTNNNQLSNGEGFIDLTDGDARYVIMDDDTVGKPNGKIMTEYAAQSAIDVIEDDLDTKLSITDAASTYVLKTTTVNGHALSSNVSITKSDVGLGNADNTSDINKPISAATQTALDSKQATLVSGTNIKTIESISMVGSGNVDLSKGDVGLSNVDNTSDANKPVSTATQTALNLKYDASNPSSYVNQSGARSAISLTTTGSGGASTYNPSTGVLNVPQYAGTVSSVGITSTTLTVTNSPITSSGNITVNIPARTASNVSRSLVTTTSSTGFQPSFAKDYQVTYSVYAQVTSALLGNNTADVYLEIAATNSTTPSDWTTISRSGIQASGVVSTSGNTQTVSGFVPAGYYVRIRTAATGANSGSASFSYQVGQENSY
jgi:hypothetical protein